MTKEEKKDLESVITFLEWTVERKKIINYINKYLIK
jgi:hypothetical protein